MRAKRCFFNAFSGLFSQFVSVALGVIIPRLVLVQLGSEANGLLSATQQALVYLDLLESGIGTAALQALYKPAAEQDRAAVSGIFNAIRREYAKVGIAYAALVCGLSVLFPFFIKTELPFFTVLLTVLLGGMGQAVRFLLQAKYRVLLQAEGRGYVLINANLLLTVSISIGKIILLICGLSLIAVQLLCFLCGLLQTALLTLYAKKQYSWLNRAVPPDTTATAQHRAVLVHQISGLIFQNTDILLLSVVCGLKTTSVYSMYVMLFGMVGTAVSAINGSVSFVLGQTYHTDRAHFLRLYRAFETYNMALTFALYLTADVFILPFLKLYTAGVTDISYLDPVLPHLFVCTYLLSNGRAARAARHRIRRAFSKNAEPFRHRIRHQSSHIAFACGTAWHVRRAHRDDCSAFVSHERYDPLRLPQAAACTRTAYLPKILMQRNVVCFAVVFRKSFAASTRLISRAAPISRRILHIQPFAVYRARLCVGL